MKKILTIAIAVMMIAVMAVSVFAADTGKIEAEDSAVANAADGVQDKPDANTDDGDEKIVGTKPVEGTTCTMTFTVNVDTAGTYTLSVRYNAKEGKTPERGFILMVNEAVVEIATPNTHSDYNTYSVAEVEVSLNAGDNTVVISSDPNKNGANVDWLAWALKEAAEPETPDEPVETPDEPEENAPQTGVAAAILSVAAVLSGAYIFSKKH